MSRAGWDYRTGWSGCPDRWWQPGPPSTPRRREGVGGRTYQSVTNKRDTEGRGRGMGQKNSTSPRLTLKEKGGFTADFTST